MLKLRIILFLILSFHSVYSEKISYERKYINKSLEFLKEKKYRSALNFINKLVRSKKKNIYIESNYIKGKILLEKKDIKEARKVWEKLIIKSQNSEWYGAIQVGLGDLSKLDGDLTKAKGIYSKHIKQGKPGKYTFECAVRLGDIEYEGSNFKSALSYYRQAEQIAKQSIYFWDEYLKNIRGKINATNHQLSKNRKKPKQDEAKITFEHATRLRQAKKWSDAKSHYELILKKYSESIYVDASNWAIGECLVGLNKIKESFEHWGKFIKDNPEGEWRGQTYISMGDVILEKMYKYRTAKKEYDKALEILEKNINNLSDSWKSVEYSIFQRQGLVYYIQNKDKEALKWFEKASKSQPPAVWKLATPNTPTGIEILISKMKMKSILTPKEVRRGDPSSAIILTLADIYYETEEIEKAKNLYNILISNGKSKANYKQLSWAHYKNAHCYGIKFQFKESISHFEKVISLFPKSPYYDEALLRIGVLYHSNLSQPDKAIECFQKLLSERPKSNEADRAAYYIADIYRWKKDYEKAIKAYKYMARKYPASGYVKFAKKYITKLIEEKNKGT